MDLFFTTERERERERELCRVILVESFLYISTFSEVLYQEWQKPKFYNLFVGITQLTEILLKTVFHLVFMSVNWKWQNKKICIWKSFKVVFFQLLTNWLDNYIVIDLFKTCLTGIKTWYICCKTSQVLRKLLRLLDCVPNRIGRLQRTKKNCIFL